MVRKVLLGCGIVSSVWYVVTDVIGSLRYPGYSYADQWFSELTAQGSPVRPLMIALNEFPYTLLVGAFAAGVWTSVTPKRAARITATMLLGYAASGFAGGVLFPMRTREAVAAGEETLRNVTLIVFGALTSLQAPRITANQPTPWSGIYERINIYATMLWVAVLATGLLRAQGERP